MAKKYQTDGNLLHHDHQPAHMHTDSSHPSISSANSTAQHHNRMSSDAGMHARSSIDYIPPEISLDDHHDSDDVCQRK